MHRLLVKICFIMLILFSSLCQAQSPPEKLACDHQTIKAIEVASKSYFEEHSGFNAADLLIGSQRCLNESASAKIFLKSAPDIDSIVYLQKTHNQWRVVLLGSDTNSPVLAQMPRELRKATGGEETWLGWHQKA